MSKTHSNVQHIGKSNVVPVHTMKAYSGSRCIAPYVFHLAVDKGKGSTTCPGCITLQERTLVPTEYEAGRPPGQEQKFWGTLQIHELSKHDSPSYLAHILFVHQQ